MVIIEGDPAVQGLDDLTVTCYCKNNYVYEFTCFSEHFNMFSTLYPEINMLREISEQFRFMETHVVRDHINFQKSQMSF